MNIRNLALSSAAVLTAATAAQAVTIAINVESDGMAAVNAEAGASVPVTVTAVLSDLDGGAFAGYALDVAATDSGSGNVAGVAAPDLSNSPLQVGPFLQAADASGIERQVAGQLPNIFNVNPDVDASGNILLFETSVDIDASATNGDTVTVSASAAASNGGVWFFTDSQGGASEELSGMVTFNDLVITIGSDAGVEGDANGDGMVTIADVLFIIARFGDAAPSDADVNGDGMVTIADVLFTIARFGN